MKIKNLILICGFSRSGTTWISKVLDSVPSTYLISEPDKRINKNIKFGNVPHCINECNDILMTAYQESLSEVTKKFDCNLRGFPFFYKDYLTVSYPIYNFFSFFFQLTNYVANKYNQPSVKLPSLLFKKDNEATLIWKSVNQSSNLPFIQKAFPNIKIVYLLRNPYSTIASLLSHNKMTLDGKDLRRIFERKESLFCQLNIMDYDKIKRYSEIEKKALLWRIDTESACIAGENTGNFYLITYENLVRDLQKEIKRLFSFIDCDVTAEVKKFLNQSSGIEAPPMISKVFSSGYFGVYRKPGIKINKWRNVIDKSSYEKIHNIVKDSPLLTYWDKDILSYD